MTYGGGAQPGSSAFGSLPGMGIFGAGASLPGTSPITLPNGQQFYVPTGSGNMSGMGVGQPYPMGTPPGSSGASPASPAPSAPSALAAAPWGGLSNWLSGLGIPSSMGANGLPQIGMHGGAPTGMPSNPLGQLGGGMGMPFWLRALVMNGGNPSLAPITSPQQSATLPGQALQNRAPAVAALPTPAPPQTPSSPLVSDQMIQQYMAVHPGVNYQMAAQLAPSGISPGLSFAQLNNNER